MSGRRYVGRHRKPPARRGVGPILGGAAAAGLVAVGSALALGPPVQDAPMAILPERVEATTPNPSPVVAAPLAPAATSQAPVGPTETVAPAITRATPPPAPVSTPRPTPAPTTTTRATTTQAPPPPSPEPVEESTVRAAAGAACSATLDGTVAHVARAGHYIAREAGFGGTMLGRASRAGTSDHPSGHAVDFMTSREQGDRVAQVALDHQEELGITYVIWLQRINFGSGWEVMEDRGGDTANHMDHVHVSFQRTAPAEEPRC